MPSSNPAFGRGFARAVNGQGSGPGAGPAPAGWGAGPQTYGAPTQAEPYSPYAAPSPYAKSATRYMTMDDVVTKTGISFLVTVLAAAVTWAVPGFLGFGWAIGAALAGFVVAMVISIRMVANPTATLTYAALEGVFLGAISEAFNARFPGVVTQAIIGTFGVFAGMLIVYKTGAIRVTPKFTRWVVGALFGALALMLVDGIAYWFGFDTGLRSGGTTAIIFSIIVIGIAAMSLLVDFAMADEAIRRGVPAKFAWYIAFGLLVTVVWLYLEILRLLSYFRE